MSCRILILTIIALNLTPLLLPADNSWRERTAMPRSLSHGGHFIVGDSVFIGCGFNGGTYNNAFYKYVVPRDEWIESAPLPGRGRNLGAAFSLQGNGYAGIGWTGAPPSEKLKDFYRYDPSSGSWERLDDFPGNANTDFQQFTIAGKGYVCGGLDGPFKSAQTWQFDPITETWTEKASMIEAISRGVGFSINSYGYVIGGNANGKNRFFYRYDAQADVWEQLGESPLEPAVWSIAFTHNGKGYIAGGWIGTATYDQFWEYDPARNEFRQLGDLPGKMYAGQAFSFEQRPFISSGKFNEGGGNRKPSVTFEYIPAEQFIATDSLSAFVYCEDADGGLVYFSTESGFAADNQFELELTEDLYDYEAGTIIASGSASPIRFDLPDDFKMSEIYKLRVNSTSPRVYGNYLLDNVKMLYYPDAPSIELRNDTLFASSFAVNHWYRDGKPYDTTNLRHLVLTEPGVYTMFTTRGCPSPFSNAIRFMLTDVEQDPQEPPPFTLRGSTIFLSQDRLHSLALYSATGRLIHGFSLAADNVAIPLSLARGLYFLIGSTSDGALFTTKYYRY